MCYQRQTATGDCSYAMLPVGITCRFLLWNLAVNTQFRQAGLSLWVGVPLLIYHSSTKHEYHSSWCVTFVLLCIWLAATFRARLLFLVADIMLIWASDGT